MSAASPAANASNLAIKTPAIVWVGRVISALPALGLFVSASVKLSGGAEVVAGLEKYGYAPSVIAPLGAVELACALLYAIPQTAVLGAILATGYLGGAVATHVSAGEPSVAPLLFGVLVWTGIGLRDARLRALLPLRSVG
jgi:hypothetical protein